MSVATTEPFDMQLFEALGTARKAEEDGIEDAYDIVFEVMSDEELVRSVWILQDTLRGLAKWQGYKGVDMLFTAQHNALLNMSMRFAKEPLLAVYPEHLRWWEQEFTAEDEDADA